MARSGTADMGGTRQIHVCCCRARTHWKLAEAGRSRAALRHRLSIHVGRSTIDMGRDIRFQCRIGAEAGIRVSEAEERVHLSHNLNDLCQFG